MGALQVICLIAGLFGANACISGLVRGAGPVESAGVAAAAQGLEMSELAAAVIPDEQPLAETPIPLTPAFSASPAVLPDRTQALVAEPLDVPGLSVSAASASPSILLDLPPLQPSVRPAIRPTTRPHPFDAPAVGDLAILLPDGARVDPTILSAASALAPRSSLRPHPRDTWAVPVARWDGELNGPRWTAAVLSALRGPGAPLLDTVPRDIREWCPGYEDATPAQRAAFWTGLISTLAWHESTHEPDAVGGGGQWFGLVQIAPGTARWRDCDAETSSELMNGAANLRCGIRIMAITVPRDGVVAAGMRGVAADWGPFHSDRKREEMRAWLREQTYCAPPAPQMRPVMRPTGLGEAVVVLSTSGSRAGVGAGAAGQGATAQGVSRPMPRPTDL